jgi:DNA-3-methyladenine glycosylase II
VAALRAADPVLRGLIDEVGPEPLGDRRAGRPHDLCGSLVRSIVGQQLSTRAARAIYSRLTDRFGARTPTPAEVLADDPDELRAAAGLSRAKVQFLRSLAEHVLDGSLELERLGDLPDEQVIASAMAPIRTSAPGLSVRFEVRSAPDPWSEKMTARPTARLVAYAPSR